MRAPVFVFRKHRLATARAEPTNMEPARSLLFARPDQLMNRHIWRNIQVTRVINNNNNVSANANEQQRRMRAHENKQSRLGFALLGELRTTATTMTPRVLLLVFGVVEAAEVESNTSASSRAWRQIWLGKSNRICARDEQHSTRSRAKHGRQNYLPACRVCFMGAAQAKSRHEYGWICISWPKRSPPLIR